MSEPKATITGDDRVIEIQIINPIEFELPTYGFFGGYGQPGEGITKPHRFRPDRVLVKIKSGVVADIAAYTDRGADYGDGSENDRHVRDGIVKKHWPTWLSGLVADMLKEAGES